MMRKLTAVAMLLLAGASYADEVHIMRLDGLTIQGRSEEPKVQFIIPWQPPPGTGRLQLDAQLLPDAWYQGLDLDVLKRDIRYAKRFARKGTEDGRSEGEK